MKLITKTLSLIFLTSLPLHTLSYGSYLSISSQVPKCVSIDVEKGGMFVVHYYSEDIKIYPEDDSKMDAAVGKEKPSGRDYNAMNNNRDPFDAMKSGRGSFGFGSGSGSGSGFDRYGNIGNRQDWQDRQKELMQKSILGKKNALSNVIIRINEFQNNYDKPRYAEIHSEALTTKFGEIKYEMKLYDQAKICVQSYGATKQKPTFMYLRVKDFYELPKEEREVESQEEKDEKEKEKKVVDNHMKYLEREMQLLLQVVQRLLSTSTHLKIAHSEFSNVSTNLHSKLRWFSIVQICITLVAAIYYVKAILAFLRKKKIIY
jgi:hypothetical protein